MNTKYEDLLAVYNAQHKLFIETLKIIDSVNNGSNSDIAQIVEYTYSAIKNKDIYDD